MERVRGFAARASRVDVPVLLMGETGTGKTLLARTIHEAGTRRDGRFVPVNCAGIPDGLFESELFGHVRGAFTGAGRRRAGLFEAAEGGTLFLDEVGELRPEQQAKLLTVLDDGRVRPVGGDRTSRVDVRVIAATARDPLLARSDGFRRDLYHRLAVLRCVLPPLRARPGDISELAGRTLRRLAGKHGLDVPRITPGGMRFLTSHPWPGNVRELLHALEAALVLCDGDALRPSLLRRVVAPPRQAPTEEGGESRGSTRYSFYGTAEEERARIRAALVRARGNKSAAARALGMARNTLASKIRKYEIAPGEIDGYAAGGGEWPSEG